MVNFTLPFTTNKMILISTSQTFRSSVVMFHLHRPIAFLSLSSYDTPGLAPNMNVWFWGPGDTPVSFDCSYTSRNDWNRYSGRLMAVTGILFSNMKFPYHECWMTLWPSTSYSDFSTNQTFNKFHDLDTELDLHRTTSIFQWTFAIGVACQQGTLTLPDTRYRTFSGLFMLHLLRVVFPHFPCLLFTFHPEYPSELSRFCIVYL